MPGKPLTNAERAAILVDLRAGLSLGQTCRKHARSRGAVGGIAKAHGISFDRTVIKNATEAKVADNKARRAVIAERLLVEVNGFIDSIRKPFLAHNFGGKDNTYAEHELPGPTTGDIRNLMVSVGIALTKHVELARFDADPGQDAAVSLRDALREQLTARDGDGSIVESPPGDVASMGGAPDAVA